MKYYIFNQTGILQKSYDSRTGASAYNSTTAPSGSGSTTGGSVATASKNILPLVTFWTDTSPMPTAYQQMEFPIVQYGTSHCASMAGEVTMNSAGYVSGLSGNINGQTDGVCYFQVYKNGQPFGIIASGRGGSKRKAVQAAGGSTYTFAAGDVLSVYLRGTTSTDNQSFSATIEVTYTA